MYILIIVLFESDKLPITGENHFYGKNPVDNFEIGHRVYFVTKDFEIKEFVRIFISIYFTIFYSIVEFKADFELYPFICFKSAIDEVSLFAFLDFFDHMFVLLISIKHSFEHSFTNS